MAPTEMSTSEVPESAGAGLINSSQVLFVDESAIMEKVETSGNSFLPVDETLSGRSSSPYAQRQTLRNLTRSSPLPAAEEVPLQAPERYGGPEAVVEALRQGVRAGMPRRRRVPETPRIDGPRPKAPPANLHRYFAQAMRKRVEVEVHRLFRHAGLSGVQGPIDSWPTALNETLDLFQEYAAWIDRRHAELSGLIPREEDEESQRCEALLQQLSKQEDQLHGVTRQHQDLQTSLKSMNRSYWRELCYLRSMLPQEIQYTEDVHFYEGEDETLAQLEKLKREVEELEVLVARLKKALAKAEEEIETREKEIETQKAYYEKENKEQADKWRARMDRMQEEFEEKERQWQLLAAEEPGLIRADFEAWILRNEETQRVLVQRLETELQEAQELRKVAEAQRDQEHARAEKAEQALQQYKDQAAKRTASLASLQQKLHDVLARAEAAAPPEGLERALEIAREELEEARRHAEAESAARLEMAATVDGLRRRAAEAEATAEDLREQIGTLKLDLQSANKVATEAKQRLGDVEEQNKVMKASAKAAANAASAASASASVDSQKPRMVDASMMTDKIEVASDRKDFKRTKTGTTAKENLTTEKFQRNVRDTSLGVGMTAVQAKKAETVVDAFKLKPPRKSAVVVNEDDTSSWNIARKNVASGKLSLLASLKTAVSASDSEAHIEGQPSQRVLRNEDEEDDEYLRYWEGRELDDPSFDPTTSELFRKRQSVKVNAKRTSVLTHSATAPLNPISSGSEEAAKPSILKRASMTATASTSEQIQMAPAAVPDRTPNPKAGHRRATLRQSKTLSSLAEYGDDKDAGTSSKSLRPGSASVTLKDVLGSRTQQAQGGLGRSSVTTTASQKMTAWRLVEDSAPPGPVTMQTTKQTLQERRRSTVSEMT